MKKTNNLFETILIIIIFCIALAWDPRIEAQFDIIKLFILQIGTLFLMTAWYINGSRIHQSAYPFSILLVVFSLWIGITTYKAFHVQSALNGSYGIFHGAFTFWIYFSLIIMIMSSPLRVNKVLKAFVIAMSIVAVYAVLQKMGFYIYGHIPYDRPYSTIGNAVSMASVISLAVPFAFYFIKDSRFWIVPLLFLIAAVYLSSSVGPQIGLIVSAFFISLYRFRKSRKSVAVVLILIFISGAILITNKRFSLKSQSLEVRASIIKSSIRIIKSNPIFGVGLGNLMNAYPVYRDIETPYGYANVLPRNAHNGYIDIAVKTGFPGLFMYLFLLGMVIKRNVNKGYYGIVFISSIAGYMVQDMTGWFSMGLTPFFFIILGLGGRR